MQAETLGIEGMFARMAAVPADAGRIAQMAVSIWADVGAALSPIIGQPGVDALFRRSIYLTRDAHPVLAPLLADGAPADRRIALQSLLAGQDATAAIATNAALLRNFQDLLTTLIGASLAERLLLPVWDTPSSGQAVQDTIS